MKKGYLYICLFLLLVFGMLVSSWHVQTSEPKAQNSISIDIEAPLDQEVHPDGFTILIHSKELSDTETVKLVVSGTYGTTILQPEKSGERWVFSIPPAISTRAGMVEWRLVQHQKTVQSGEFELMPTVKNLGKLENYLGPRSIVASERDYTMQIAIPTDSLDNMLPDRTQLSLNHQFKNQITKTPASLKNGFAWQRIQAPLTTGRITVSSTLQNISSKELVADVFPDVAIDFQIIVDQNHTYADGNEITTFKTSRITDKHGNVMTDGTLVQFFMSDASGTQWQTMGSTINGYAFAKAIHPQTPTTWQVKAVIQGIAESPDLEVTFKSVIEEIPVRLQKDKTLIVGPLTSYLGQIIPDGVQVTIDIEGKNHVLLTENGIVKLPPIQDGIDLNSTVTISALGVTKTSKIASLENE